MINFYDLPFDIICKIYYIKNKNLKKIYRINYLKTLNELKKLHNDNFFTFFRGRRILTNIKKNIIWYDLQLI